MSLYKVWFLFLQTILFEQARRPRTTVFFKYFRLVANFRCTSWPVYRYIGLSTFNLVNCVLKDNLNSNNFQQEYASLLTKSIICDIMNALERFDYMRIMVIDIGSNTIKHDIYQIVGQERRKLSRGTETVGMLSYIKDGVLLPEGEEKLMTTLGHFHEKAERFACKRVCCLTTAGFRAINNPKQLISRIKAAYGFDFLILSGEDEAALSFEGFISSIPEGNSSGIMIDLGGASTEVVQFENKRIVDARSLAFGSLRLKNDYVDEADYPTSENVAPIRADVKAAIAEKFPTPPKKRRDAYIIGGTAMAVGKLHRMVMGIDFVNFDRCFELTIEQFRTLLYRYLEINDNNDAILREEFPDRFRYVVPGMLAYDELFWAFGCERVFVSPGGIRDGFVARGIR